MGAGAVAALCVWLCSSLTTDYSLFYMQADFIGIRFDMPITVSLTAAPSGGAVLAAPLSHISANRLGQEKQI